MTPSSPARAGNATARITAFADRIKCDYSTATQFELRACLEMTLPTRTLPVAAIVLLAAGFARADLLTQVVTTLCRHPRPISPAWHGITPFDTSPGTLDPIGIDFFESISGEVTFCCNSSGGIDTRECRHRYDRRIIDVLFREPRRIRRLWPGPDGYAGASLNGRGGSAGALFSASDHPDYENCSACHGVGTVTDTTPADLTAGAKAWKIYITTTTQVLSAPPSPPIDTNIESNNVSGMIAVTYNYTGASAPEPATSALFGGAVLPAGIVLRRRRRR